MSVTCWRICKRKHAAGAFSGEGASEFGGRWNTAGTEVVYTAGSQSLAILEMLVHLSSPELLESYVLIPVDIDELLISAIDVGELPRGWNGDPPPLECQRLGDEWAASLGSVVLRVPSAIVPSESNFLLNPRHPEFSRLRIGNPVPFRFDPRFVR